MDGWYQSAMRWVVLAGAVVVSAVIASAPAAAPAPGGGTLLETLVVPFGHAKGQVFTTKTTLQANAVYTIVVSGTASLKYASASKPDVLDAVHYFTDQPKPAEPLRLQKAGGSSHATLSQWAGKEYGGLPYRSDHIYTVVLSRDRSVTGRLQVFSDQGYTGNCAHSGVSCSGEFTVKLFGPQTTTDTVSFLFTQGGVPKDAPKDLIDVRTVGRGSITFVNERPDETERVVFNEITKASANVTRELDFAVHPDLKLTFRLRSPVEAIVLYQQDNPGDPLMLRLDLEVASSTDERCPATKAGKPRTAQLRMIDGQGRKPDQVLVLVTGCAYNDLAFTGRLGKGSRVNVTIVHKRAATHA